MDKLHQAEPEIREDLQGRIEVFDPSTGGFKKRFEIFETCFCMEVPHALQTDQKFSGKFSGVFPEENTGSIISGCSSIAGSSIIPQVPSVSPEFSVRGNPFLLDMATSVSDGNISSFGSIAALPSGENSNLSTDPIDSSSGISGTSYKIRSINEAFSSVSESLRSLQAAISELSNFTHSNLKLEIKKLDMELRNFKAQEDTKNAYIKELESRIEILENQNMLTLGSMKILFEISGVASSLALFFIGFLIWSGRWDVIRSPYFSIGLAVLMAGAVFMKFYIANRSRKTLTDSF